MRKPFKNVRIYGNKPFRVALIHGGPGAAGEMAPVARVLDSRFGILEPLQTASSVDGQVKELKTILQKYGEPPVTLVGFSWGAWLSYILAAQYPSHVNKLILVGSGSFKEKYILKIYKTRLKRLSKKERKEIKTLSETLDNTNAEAKNRAFQRMGKLFSKSDAYHPIMVETEIIDYQVEIFKKVWREAAEWRKEGRLLELGKKIQCPVIAIHGDYDPHPAEGVLKPLSEILHDFRFFLLKNCGHKPWIEKDAKEKFYSILKEEIENDK